MAHLISPPPDKEMPPQAPIGDRHTSSQSLHLTALLLPSDKLDFLAISIVLAAIMGSRGFLMSLMLGSNARATTNPLPDIKSTEGTEVAYFDKDNPLAKTILSSRSTCVQFCYLFEGTEQMDCECGTSYSVAGRQTAIRINEKWYIIGSPEGEDNAATKVATPQEKDGTEVRSTPQADRKGGSVANPNNATTEPSSPNGGRKDSTIRWNLDRPDSSGSLVEGLRMGRVSAELCFSRCQQWPRCVSLTFDGGSSPGSCGLYTEAPVKWRAAHAAQGQPRLPFVGSSQTDHTLSLVFAVYAALLLWGLWDSQRTGRHPRANARSETLAQPVPTDVAMQSEATGVTPNVKSNAEIAGERDCATVENSQHHDPTGNILILISIFIGITCFTLVLPNVWTIVLVCYLLCCVVAHQVLVHRASVSRGLDALYCVLILGSAPDGQRPVCSVAIKGNGPAASSRLHDGEVATEMKAKGERDGSRCSATSPCDRDEIKDDYDVVELDTQ